MSKKNVAWARSAVVGPHFLACIGVGGYIGHRIDEHYGTDPIWLLVFLGLGMAAGFVNLFKELAAVNREEAAAEAEANEDADDKRAGT